MNECITALDLETDVAQGPELAVLELGFRAPLEEPAGQGWNQIANPFAFPVRWDDVARGPKTGNPHAYGPLEEGISVGELVDALNVLGVTARDMIAIFEAMRAAGALHADLVIL